MKRILFLIALCLTGCDGGCSKIKKTVGIESTPPSAEDIQKQQDEARRAREEAAKRLQEGDAMVHNFAERAAKIDSNGGFQKHEGLTEIDPWGTTLKVD